MVVLVPAPGDLGHMHSFLWAAVSFSVQEKELSLPFRVGKRAWAAAVYILGTQKKKKNPPILFFSLLESSLLSGR